MRNLLLALLLSSLCACTMPMNPDEYKQEISGHALGAKENYTVPLAYNTVLANLKSAAERCLNYTTNGILTNHGYVALPARVTGEVHVLKPGQAQLTIQNSSGTSFFNGGKKPENGWYIFVADFASASPTSTSMTVYSGQFGSFADRVKTWAGGSDMSCPIL